MANDVTINVETTGANQAANQIMTVGSATQDTSRVIVQSMGTTEAAFDTAVRSSSRFGAAMDKAQGGGAQLADGLGAVASMADAVSDAMSYADRKAEELARAQDDVAQAAFDVKQAMQDMAQATRDATQADIDLKQAGIDVEQALVDKATAQADYNKAVKEFGANSSEAKQAMVDMKQADLDLTQAQEDAKQAADDLAQAHLDAEQGAIDRTAAEHNLTAAQRELAKQGSTLQKVSEWAGMLSGILGGLVGIIGMVTAVQWAWNIAMTANPVGIIIMAVVALIAVIVLIATKTTWFQDLWNVVWTFCKEQFDNFVKGIMVIWDWLSTNFMAGIEVIKNFIVNGFKFAIDFVVNYFKFLMSLPGKVIDVFKSIGEGIYAPFKWAFNMISRGWNSSVGRLSFTFPSWIPMIGGNSFSMPRLPSLATGGDIMRTGAVFAHKGERIIPAGTRGLNSHGSGAPLVLEIRLVGGNQDLIRWVKKNTRILGGGGPNSVQIAWSGAE